MENLQKKRRLTIGLLVGNTLENGTARIINGMMNAVKTENINIVIFPGKHIFHRVNTAEYHQWEYQYNTLFDLPDKHNIDGLLIAVRNIGRMTTKEKFRDFLKAYEDIPTVLMEKAISGYPSVSIDVESGLKEGLEYLIHKEHCTKICMIGGAEHDTDSIVRKNIYRTILEENGISFEERYFVESISREHEPEAFETLLDRNPDMHAVFCFHDVIALRFYEALKNRGLSAGRDVKVLGYGNSAEGIDAQPQLSTVGHDVNDMCDKSLKLLLKLIRKEPAESIVIPTRLIARSSIVRESFLKQKTSLQILKSCDFDLLFNEIFYKYHPDENEINFKRCFFEIIKRIITALENRYIDDSDYEELCRLVDIFFSNGALKYTDIEYFLSYFRKLKADINRDCEGFRYRVRMQELGDYIDECVIRSLNNASKSKCIEENQRKDQIKQFVERSIRFKHGTDKDLIFIFRDMHLFGATDAFVYLLENKGIHLIHERFRFPDILNMKLFYHNGKARTVVNNRQGVPKHELFANLNSFSNNKVFIALPLYYEEYIYGFFICNMTPKILTESNFISEHCGVAVRLLYLIRENEEMVRNLEEKIDSGKDRKSDDISGEDGIFNSEEEFIDNVRLHLNNDEQKEDIIVGIVSINHMKIINERFGREEGDNTIQFVTKLLHEYIGERGFIFRSNRDEFRFAFNGHTSLNMVKKQILDLFQKLNEESGKPYNISVGIGLGRIPYGVERDLDEAFVVAEDEHYIDKLRKSIYIIKENKT